MEIVLAPDLADSLRAAALDRGNIHNDLCTVYGEDQGVCSCGMPRLLTDLAALLLPAPAHVMRAH